jgi:hypothetical protein
MEMKSDMARERCCSPDPILSANVYASGLLDDVLERAILPFWREIAATGLDQRCQLWVVRYSRGGDHLKLRIHGDPADRDILARMLAEHVHAYLAIARAMAPASPRISRPDAPAIDPEDASTVLPPDRTLLWTTYRRSHVSLGGPPWIGDDLFAALACECLAAGCELALTATEEGALESSAARQRALVKGLVAGLGALSLGGLGETAGYLRHHRDVLFRFFIDETEKEQRMLQRFDEQVRRTAVDRLGAVARALWTTADGSMEGEARWPRAVAALAAYTGTFAGRPEYQVHRFTSNVTFPPAFKVFHGLANQLGVGWLDEAFTHHLLLAAVDVPAAGIAVR